MESALTGFEVCFIMLEKNATWSENVSSKADLSDVQI